MRLAFLLVGTSILAGCGAGGGTSIGSVGTAAPAAPAAPSTNASDHTFVTPTKEQTYQSNGASHTFDYSVEVDNFANTSTGQQKQLYAGNSTTVRQSGLSIAYNPRDAIFDIKLSDPQSRLTFTTRFQDPVHRTDFGGAIEPQSGTPKLTLPGLQYLQATTVGASTTNNGFAGNTMELVLPPAKNSLASFSQDTFFYQKPGTTTKYVTFAGFLRNNLSATKVDIDASPATPTTPAIAASSKTTYSYSLTRGASVYGELTLNSNVPKSGSASYTGSMLATAIINDQLDTNRAPSYFQWIEGTSITNVNFGSNTFSLALNGNVLAPQLDGVTDGSHTVKAGAKFNAEGKGQVDLVSAGGFIGQFQKVWFVNPDNSQIQLMIAGSTIDGAFYGPAAQEVGGSYRIVGGSPDERIDILGVFTGK